MSAATAQAHPAMDARGWDEAAYRRGILRGRDLSCRTLFRAVFFDHSDEPDPDVLLAAASSDGSLASFSLSSCISSATATPSQPDAAALVDPVCIVQAHRGPAYDVRFYPDPQQPLLFSCGDDGRIRGWRWHEMQSCLVPLSLQGDHLEPALDLVNPQHEGPWGARSPIPENNAIAINKQEGSIFAAAGDACAYCWDVESGKCKMTFKGHTDYLHSIAVREANRQVVTGSEDGTARIWDCRGGKCTQVIHPVKNKAFKSSWVSCVAIDASESWLACGTSSGVSVWSLLSNECVFNLDCHAPVQDLLFDKNQILAVGAEPVLSRFTINGTVLSQIKCAPQSAFSVSIHSSGIAAVAGYGGLVDVISELGSHLCTFGSRGLDK
ncbi:THO complex subunit 6-like [Phragmites australis]|uniref:THO complex subunit 6-like n=1 Tax=Phragmites australis TaxID=29695 RepID=UPI002D797EA2|nr:THO complex subunit 6-like [Phragmites australis]